MEMNEEKVEIELPEMEEQQRQALVTALCERNHLGVDQVALPRLIGAMMGRKESTLHPHSVEFDGTRGQGGCGTGCWTGGGG